MSATNENDGVQLPEPEFKPFQVVGIQCGHDITLGLVLGFCWNPATETTEPFQLLPGEWGYNVYFEILSKNNRGTDMVLAPHYYEHSASELKAVSDRNPYPYIPAPTQPALYKIGDGFYERWSKLCVVVTEISWGDMVSDDRYPFDCVEKFVPGWRYLLIAFPGEGFEVREECGWIWDSEGVYTEEQLTERYNDRDLEHNPGKSHVGGFW